LVKVLKYGADIFRKAFLVKLLKSEGFKKSLKIDL